MAEKDAYYYYKQAQNARENGNERLAAIMENYARQIDPVYQDRAIRAGFADPPQERGGWNPASNPNAPTRESLQNMYNQKMAMEQPQPVYGGNAPASAPVSSGEQNVAVSPGQAVSVGGQPPVVENTNADPSQFGGYGGSFAPRPANDLETQANLDPSVFEGGYVNNAEFGGYGGNIGDYFPYRPSLRDKAIADYNASKGYISGDQLYDGYDNNYGYSVSEAKRSKRDENVAAYNKRR